MFLNLLVETLEARVAAAVADREPPLAPILGKGRDGSGQKSWRMHWGKGAGYICRWRVLLHPVPLGLSTTKQTAGLAASVGRRHGERRLHN